MTTFKQRLRNELQESINYVLTEAVDPPSPRPMQSDAETGEPIVPDAINSDMAHLFNLNDVDVVSIIAENPDITFGEVTELTKTTSWKPQGHTEVKTRFTIGWPWLDAIGRLGHMLLGGDESGIWFQEQFIINNGLSTSQVAFEKTNQVIVDSKASGTQEDVRSVLNWGQANP